MEIQRQFYDHHTTPPPKETIAFETYYRKGTRVNQQVNGGVETEFYVIKLRLILFQSLDKNESRNLISVFFYKGPNYYQVN